MPIYIFTIINSHAVGNVSWADKHIFLIKHPSYCWQQQVAARPQGAGTIDYPIRHEQTGSIDQYQAPLWEENSGVIKANYLLLNISSEETPLLIRAS